MSRKLIKFCVIYFLCSPKLSEPKTESPRVFNGEETSHKIFPFAISMLTYRPNVRRWSYSCGGSLISEWTVLTAAHCVVVYPSYQGAACVPKYPGNLLIIAGADYVWRPSSYKQQSFAKSIAVHPSCFFNQEVLAYDTAVVTVQTRFVWSDYVQPFRLFSGDPVRNLGEFDRIARSGEKCYVVGFGNTNFGSLSDFIQLGYMTLLTNSQCNEKFCQYNSVFCDVDFSETGWACASTGVSTPCPGDSGGPLVCNGLLFGVVNWGRGCFSDISNPAVFADMAAITYMVNLFKTGETGRLRAINQSDSGNLQLRCSYRITLGLAFLLLLR